MQIYWKKIPALIAKAGAVPQWDAASSSPYFSYAADNGTSHVVWYENAESIPLKSTLAVSYNLAGVSVFALGFEDQTFWECGQRGFGRRPTLSELFHTSYIYEFNSRHHAHS